MYVAGLDLSHGDDPNHQKNRISLGASTFPQALASGPVKVDGNAALLAGFLALLKSFEAKFNIVTPGLDERPCLQTGYRCDKVATDSAGVSGSAPDGKPE